MAKLDLSRGSATPHLLNRRARVVGAGAEHSGKRFQLDWHTVRLFLYRCFKRLGDIIVSALGIILLGIPMVIAAVAIKIESRGPVLDLAERIGKDGRPFVLMRFQTGHEFSQSDEPARTASFLRRTHLDAAPQLFNVLMGSMSIIGPSAESREFYRASRQEIPQIRQRLLVRPGMSGLEKAAGATELARGTESPNVEYVRMQRGLLDLKIFALTLFVLFHDDNGSA